MEPVRSPCFTRTSTQPAARDTERRAQHPAEEGKLRPAVGCQGADGLRRREDEPKRRRDAVFGSIVVVGEVRALPRAEYDKDPDELQGQYQDHDGGNGVQQRERHVLFIALFLYHRISFSPAAPGGDLNNLL